MRWFFLRKDNVSRGCTVQGLVRGIEEPKVQRWDWAWDILLVIVRDRELLNHSSSSCEIMYKG